MQPFSLGTLLSVADRAETELSLTIGLVEARCVPQVIEFVLHAPADVARAGSELVESLDRVAPLRWGQFRNQAQRLGVHADQGQEVALVFNAAGLEEAQRLLAVE